MAITNLQTKNITIGTPVGIDSAVNQIRLKLNDLSWVTHPYFIAQRFVKKAANKKTYLLPEVYARKATDTNAKYDYKTLTPDNDFKGMFFAYLPTGSNQTQNHRSNFISYRVSFIFSVNLESIDKAKLNNGLFTRELMRDVRRVLNANKASFVFGYDILQETDDLKMVFREFVIDDVERYNRAPLQCFRFDLNVTIQEDCI